MLFCASGAVPLLCPTSLSSPAPPPSQLLFFTPRRVQRSPFFFDTFHQVFSHFLGLGLWRHVEKKGKKKGFLFWNHRFFFHFGNKYITCGNFDRRKDQSKLSSLDLSLECWTFVVSYTFLLQAEKPFSGP